MLSYFPHKITDNISESMHAYRFSLRCEPYNSQKYGALNLSYFHSVCAQSLILVHLILNR